jgi:hypothetical protein
MKAKCFHCHRLRIAETKLNVLANALKFTKAGEIIGSQRLKAHFFALAREMASLKPQDAEDAKKVAKIKNAVNQIMGTHSRSEKFTDESVKEQLSLFHRRFNIEREKFENDIMDMLDRVELNKYPEDTNKIAKSGMTSIIQKFQNELIKEMWSNVVTTKCPHCKQSSPAFRKDGYTKMFVKPLLGKGKAAQDQR